MLKNGELTGKNRLLDPTNKLNLNCAYFLPDFQYGPYGDEESVTYKIGNPNSLAE